MKKRVISPKNLPSKIPVYQALIVYLMLDKLNAADWVWGVMGTIMAVVIIGSLIEINKETKVEVL